MVAAFVAGSGFSLPFTSPTAAPRGSGHSGGGNLNSITGFHVVSPSPPAGAVQNPSLCSVPGGCGDHRAHGLALGLASAPGSRTWTNIGASIGPAPSTREQSGLAYDSTDHQLVLFGGWGPENLTYGPSNQTWTFSNGSWRIVDTREGPPALAGPLLADDPGERGVILWGGGGLSSAINITWLYSAGAWANLSGQSGPAPPAGSYGTANMVYDSTDGRLVLITKTGSTLNTWEFSGGRWENVTPSVSPGTTSYEPLLVDDPADRGVLLVGGATVNETWLFSSSTWTRLSPSTPLPLLYFPTATYDPVSNAPLVYGGLNYSGGSPGVRANQTWLFANHSWSRLPVSRSPPSVMFGSSAYDSADGLLAVFGGLVNYSNHYSLSNETWALGPSVLARPVVAPNPADVGVNVSFRDPYANTTAGYAQHWDLGDGNASTLSDVTHPYPAAGTYTVLLNASTGPGEYNNSSLTVSVFPRPSAAIHLSPSATDVGVPVALGAQVVGGAPPFRYLWDLGDASTASTANVTHAYTTPGVYSVSLILVDNAGISAEANASVTVAAQLGAQLRINWPVLDLGQTLRAQTVVTNGTAPISVTYVGLQLGCPQLNVSSFSCTPVVEGSFTLWAFAVDARGVTARTDSVPYSVYPTLAPILAEDRSQIDLGQWVNLSIVLHGGAPGPFQYSYSGLPPGCTPPVSGSAVRCQPTQAGTYSLAVSVNDSSAAPTSSGVLTLVVNPNPTLSVTSTPANLTVGASVLIEANITGGSPPYSYDFEGLPPGCSTANQSQLPCVPKAAGTYNITVSVVDSVGVERIRNLTLNVIAPQGPSNPTAAPPSEVELAVVGVAAVLIVAAAVVLLRRRVRPKLDRKDEPARPRS